MSFDMTILQDAGLSIKTGIDYTGGQDKYISAIQRFYKNYEKNRQKVEEYYKAADYENYMITVHALKSNAKMIGALHLSESFEELENAAREGNADIINEKTVPTLSEYSGLIERIKLVGEMDEVRASDEISADVAKETADKLLEALDDFDDELSKELAIKLSGYPFRITQSERLKEAIACIDDFMYDDAAEIIKEIYPTIE